MVGKAANLRRQARDRAFVEQKQKLATANHLLAVAPAPAGRDSRAGPVLFPAGSPCGREAPVRKTMRDCLRTPDCEQLLVRRGVVRSAELRSNRARFAAVPGAERDARATPSSCAARARAPKERRHSAGVSLRRGRRKSSCGHLASARHTFRITVAETLLGRRDC
jgi:hypothetical protein